MFVGYLLRPTSGSNMETARFPETMIPIYHTVRRHMQEGSKIKDFKIIMKDQEAEILTFWDPNFIFKF
jgi:hypothetical protein